MRDLIPGDMSDKLFLSKSFNLYIQGVAKSCAELKQFLADIVVNNFCRETPSQKWQSYFHFLSGKSLVKILVGQNRKRDRRYWQF